MTEEGTLSIVGQPYGYRVCYASNDAYGLERQPATGLDEAGVAALLAVCGVGSWAIQQACAELHAGRMAILPLVGTRGQLDATFPHVPTSEAHGMPPPLPGAVCSSRTGRDIQRHPRRSYAAHR